MNVYVIRNAQRFGPYDALPNYWLVSLIMVFVGLMLLTVYLKQSVDYQSKLRQ